jgi:hypothetical protein
MAREIDRAEDQLPAACYRLAGWIMHDKEFTLSDYGYVELSIQKTVRQLRMPKRTVVRAFALLERYRWLVRIPGASAHSTTGYGLGIGRIPRHGVVPWMAQG